MSRPCSGGQYGARRLFVKGQVCEARPGAAPSFQAPERGSDRPCTQSHARAAEPRWVLAGTCILMLCTALLLPGRRRQAPRLRAEAPWAGEYLLPPAVREMDLSLTYPSMRCFLHMKKVYILPPANMAKMPCVDPDGETMNILIYSTVALTGKEGTRNKGRIFCLL